MYLQKYYILSDIHVSILQIKLYLLLNMTTFAFSRHTIFKNKLFVLIIY
jgi:hypothetical protein